MGTDKKSLNSIPLTGLILTNDSLENIIENDELEAKLANYATKEYADEAAKKALEGYVPLSDYTALQQKLVDLEASIAEISVNTFGPDHSAEVLEDTSISALLQQLDGRVDRIDEQLNGFSLSSVSQSAFDPSQANDKTFYFVTPDEEVPPENGASEEQIGDESSEEQG